MTSFPHTLFFSWWFWNVVDLINTSNLIIIKKGEERNKECLQRKCFSRKCALEVREKKKEGPLFSFHFFSCRKSGEKEKKNNACAPSPPPLCHKCVSRSTALRTSGCYMAYLLERADNRKKRTVTCEQNSKMHNLGSKVVLSMEKTYVIGVSVT